MTQTNLGSTPVVAAMRKWGVIFLAAGAVGLAATFAISGQQRFMADYLLGFWYFAGISVTMVFFSALQYLTRAGWSSAIRRIAENFSGFVPVIGIALIPIVADVLTGHGIYEWTHESAKSDPLLIKKEVYLNNTFFFVRLGLYALLWFAFVRYIVGNSVKQDTASDFRPSQKNWKRSAPWILLYAMTITFASFDLLMSLEPHWFSTIWGVYAFAGHFVAAIAIVTLATTSFYRAGYLREYITEEHFHDLGKLMFAFSVFWTYIAFSQYFIIWYANLPEETIYFTHRTQGGWEFFGAALVLLHFVIPFITLLRQDVKRKLTILRFAAVVILLSHFVDLAWIIMPAVGKVMAHGNPDHHSSFVFGWQEFTGVMFFGGVFLFLASRLFTSRNAVAVNDPLLHEAVEYTS